MNEKISHKISLTFYGGVEGVTGSNFLIESETVRVLVDGGFFQGAGTLDPRNLSPLPYNPSALSYIFVTHAHLDHVGRIPKIVKEGFRGKIISTPPTKDLARLMLLDSFEVIAEHAKKDGTQLPYEKEDIEKTFSLWHVYPYRQELTIGDGITVKLRDAGHALGSAMIEFRRNGAGLLITGDIGNSPTPLLRDTETVGNIKYLVMESVYGDRIHEARASRRERLEDIIENAVRNRGALLIPAFSLERTQELLFEISTLMAHNKIPLIPVFLDSPLAINITEVYRRYKDYFNEEAQSVLGKEKTLFAFPQLHITPTREDSKIIDRIPNPKIIIAGSGMSVGGRILYHERQYLPDKATTLLLLGYQAPGSLGRLLEEGAKQVNILGVPVMVQANVIFLGGYSAHRDSEGLFQFAMEIAADTTKKVFVAMGEPKASTFFAQRLRDYLGLDAIVPRLGSRYELEM